jgi:uncharacterized membrane protein
MSWSTMVDNSRRMELIKTYSAKAYAERIHTSDVAYEAARSRIEKGEISNEDIALI